MSRSIDKRIVEMQFDNKHFERNVQTSMSTLDKLKASLNLKGATNGLDNVGKAVKGVNFNPIHSGLDGMQAHFSALQVVAATVLSNITNSAVDAGKKLLGAMIGPLTEGGKQRALNIEQAKFQFKGLGMDVEATMADASYAVDGTAYSLDAAAKVASQLGASGMRAGEDMRKSLRAVSGVAAMAGSSYEDVGNVFTKVAGQGRLMGDDLLRLSARGINAAATLAKSMGKTEAEVRDMVTKGQINFQMFADAMDSAFGEHATAANETFTGAMSNVKSALARIGEKFYTPFHQNLIAPLNEFRGVVNEVNKAIDPAFVSLSNFMELASGKAVASLGNMDFTTLTKTTPVLVEIIKNTFTGLSSVMKPIRDAFREIFPPILGEQVYAFTVKIQKLTETFKMSDENADKLRRTFKGVFAVLDIGKQAFIALFNAIKPAFGITGDLSDGILGVTARLGDWLVKLNEAIRASDFFNNVIIKMVEIFKKWLGPIKDIGTSLFDGMAGRMSYVSEVAQKMKVKIGEAFKSIKASAEASGIVGFFEALGTVLSTVFGFIFRVISGVSKGIAESLRGADFSGALDFFNTLSLGGVAIGISKFLKKIEEPFDAIDNVLGKVTGILDGVKASLTTWQEQLKAKTLMTIATAIGILAVSLLVLSTIDSKKLAYALSAMAGLFAQLLASMALFSKIDKLSVGAAKTISMLVGMSIAVLILASALKKIGSLEWGEIAKGLVGIAGLMAILTATAFGLSKIEGPMMRGALKIVIFAAAIKILASACIDLSTLSWGELARGLVGVGVLLGAVSLFLNTAKMGPKAMTTATGIVILAASMKIFASAMKDFGGMEWDEIEKGLTSMGFVLLGTAMFSKFTSNAKHIISSGIALIAIAASMKIFASAMKDFGGMEWDEIEKGLTSMGLALVGITLALNLMPKNTVAKSVALIGIATALNILAVAIKSAGSMSWSEIAKGLTSMGLALLGITLAVNLMPKNLPLVATGLIGIAIALSILTPVLKQMGSMDMMTIGKGFLVLAGTFAIIGGAAILLKAAIPAMLGLAAVITLLGIASLAVGAGMLVFSAGLAALAVSGAAGAGALTLIITNVTMLIPKILIELAKGIVEFVKVIGEGAPELGKALVALIKAAVDALVQTAGILAEGLLTLIYESLSKLAEYTPLIGNKLFDILIGMLEVLSTRMPELVRVASEMLSNFFTAVFTEIGDLSPESLVRTVACVAAIIVCMAALAAVGKMAQKAIIGIVLMTAVMAGITAIFLVLGGLPVDTTIGVATALSKLLLSLSASMVLIALVPIPAALAGIAGLAIVVAGLAAIIAAMGAIAQIPGFKWIMEEGTQALGLIGTAIGTFAGNIAGGFLNGVSGSFPQIGSDLSAFMENAKPFLDGLKNIDESATKGVKALAEAILVLTAASILESLTSWLTGGTSIVQFGKDLAEFAPHFKKYADSIQGIDGATVEASANAAKALAEFASNIPNEGGFLAKIVGENSITKFAEELVVFGPKFKKYADSIQGIDGSAVEASANAADSLAAFADNIPNSGGLVALITGENSIAKFAEELAIFGPKFKKYADSVKGIDGSAVEASANAADTLVDLAEKIPNSGGLISLFTGNNDLSTFGEELVKFGTSMQAYYDSIKGIATAQLSNVTTEFSKLIDFMINIPEINSSGISSFSDSLASLGKASVDSFIAAFTGANAKVTAAAESMIAAFISGIDSRKSSITLSVTSMVETALTGVTNKKAAFQTAGQTLITSFINGVRSNESKVRLMFDGVISASLLAITSRYSAFNAAGQTLMTNFINGIVSRRTSMSSHFTSGLNGAVSAIRTYYTSFYNSGSYLVSGFTNGITQNTYKAAAAASAMANAAERAAKRALGIRSPSRVFYKIGDFTGMGFVNALFTYGSIAANAGRSMADSAIEGVSKGIAKISDIINGDIDTQPTIRPVLDLSGIQNGSSQLDGLFARRTMTLAAETSMTSRNSSMLEQLGDIVKDMKDTITRDNGVVNSRPLVIEVPLNLDGREAARAVAQYVSEEQERTNYFNSRNGGVR